MFNAVMDDFNAYRSESYNRAYYRCKVWTIFFRNETTPPIADDHELVVEVYAPSLRAIPPLSFPNVHFWLGLKLDLLSKSAILVKNQLLFRELVIGDIRAV